LQIGKHTRKGTFIEYGHRAISAADTHTVNDLYKFFCPIYKGLDVKVSEAESFEDVSEIIQSRDPTPDNNIGHFGKLSGFKIKYNENEQKLFEDIVNLRKEQDAKVKELEKSITERYKELSYTKKDHGYFSMNLATENNGTYCYGLPVKSQDFFRVVKDGVDESEKLLITPPQNNDNEIPY
jgi:hypothetical protein